MRKTMKLVKREVSTGILGKQQKYGRSKQSVEDRGKISQFEFNIMTKGFRTDIKNQREYMEYLGSKLNFKSMEDWYGICHADFKNNGGGGVLIGHYNDSPSKAVETIFHDHKWHPFKFNVLPRGYWEDTKNQREYMEYLGDKLNFKSMEDWYKISYSDFSNNGGEGLLYTHFNKSPSKAVVSILDHHKWQVFKFNIVPHGYWEDLKNQREYMEYLGDKLYFKSMEDWYKISGNDFKSDGNFRLIQGYYHDSPIKAVESLFSEHKWQIFKFHTVPKGYWKDANNQREFMEYLGDKLNFKSMEDWYKIVFSDFRDNGGDRLIGYYNDSPSKCVIKVFPNKKWLPWLFTNKKGGNNDQDYISWLKKTVKKWEIELNIKHPKIWYNTNRDKIMCLQHGDKLIRDNASLYKVLKLTNSKYKWKKEEFDKRGKTSSQSLLKYYVVKLFPESEDELEYNYKHEMIISPKGNRMELDIYIPSLNLAFEYNGDQHYMNTEFHAPLHHASQKEKDVHKAIECQKAGITLITIPYWWNRQFESLIGTIYKFRPDLVVDPRVGAIPLENPNTLQKRLISTQVNPRHT